MSSEHRLTDNVLLSPGLQANQIRDHLIEEPLLRVRRVHEPNRKALGRCPDDSTLNPRKLSDPRLDPSREQASIGWQEELPGPDPDEVGITLTLTLRGRRNLLNPRVPTRSRPLRCLKSRGRGREEVLTRRGMLLEVALFEMPDLLCPE